MTYEDFSEILNVPHFDKNQNAAIILNSAIPDEEFMAFFTEHVSNIRFCFHTVYYNRTFIVINNDAVIDDSLSNYEVVVPLIAITNPGDSE
jgi:hypothetical protein